MNKEKPDYGVYVIFHGALAFHDDPESSVIDVYMPEVMPHLYKAGSWGAEKVIHGPRELLALHGVPSAPTTQVNSMRGHENVINVDAPIVPGADYRARIRFPRPSRIYYCKKVEVKVAVGVQPPKPITWAQVPVFAYESNGADLALTGRAFHWMPNPEGSGTPEPEPFTLHVLATGEIPGADLGPAMAGEMFGERVHIWDPAAQTDALVDDEIKDLKVRGRLYEVDMVLPARTMMMRTISAFFRSYNFEDLTSEDLTLKYKELKTELITITTIVDKTSCGPVGGG